jgi:hypothetical protein
MSDVISSRLLNGGRINYLERDDGLERRDTQRGAAASTLSKSRRDELYSYSATLPHGLPFAEMCRPDAPASNSNSWLLEGACFALVLTFTTGM